MKNFLNFIINYKKKIIIINIFIIIFIFPKILLANEIKEIIYPEKIADPFFTISSSTPAYIDYDLTPLDQLNVSTTSFATLNLYFKEGVGTATTSKFKIYFATIRNEELYVDENGFLELATTTHDNYINFNIPTSYFSNLEKFAGFVIQPLSNGYYKFHGPNNYGFEKEESIKQLLTLTITFENKGNNIKNLLSKEIQLEPNQKEKLNLLLNTTNKIASGDMLVQCEKSWWEKWYFSVIGIISPIIFFLSWAYKLLKRKFNKNKFRKLFGQDIFNDFNLVLSRMIVDKCYDENGKLIEFPLTKPGVQNARFRNTGLVSFAATRSAKYFFEIFAKNNIKSPKISSDEDLFSNRDISYISIGGLNNLKTVHLLESDENIFYDFLLSNNSISSKQNKQIFTINDNFDFGFIIKIIPKQFTDKAWFAVAGLGEWGTSGAMWYLVNNWENIQKKAKNKAFGLIIKTKMGSDESTQLVDEIYSNKK